MIDFPFNKLMPIFLSIQEMTLPYQRITSMSLKMRQSFVSYLKPQSFMLFTHSSKAYYSP